jgi:predicted DNA-binding protein (MmcQ/YjbR family)
MMGRDIGDVIRDICLRLPEAWEKTSHGMAEYRVGKRSFATFAVNHHGDGRIALWLSAPQDAQQHHVGRDPERYFVPPYVGVRGWIGVHLDRGLGWADVDARVREAYLQKASPALADRLGPPEPVAPPDTPMDPERVDPLANPRIQEIVGQLRRVCLTLPEVTETTQFGQPAWKAGKKTFAVAHRYRGRLELQFWVGAEAQTRLTLDERYRIPDYIGHNGWISLDAEDGAMTGELEQLALDSYRHFALKRMRKALDGT